MTFASFVHFPQSFTTDGTQTFVSAFTGKPEKDCLKPKKKAPAAAVAAPAVATAKPPG